MSQFQIARCLVAADSTDAVDSGSTYFLYAQDSLLVSKEWTGKSFAPQTVVAESVRPDSSAAYILTSSVQLIVYIDTSSKLQTVLFDDDSDEWYEDESYTASHEVHPTGHVAACLNDRGDVIILFQGKTGHLHLFNHNNSESIIQIPVRPVIGSPLRASFVRGTLYVFYVSAEDNCMHYTISKNNTWKEWKDNKWSSHPFEGVAKQFIVESKRRNVLEFEAHVLTKERKLLHVAVGGQWEKLGRLDEKGDFISERSVDICCIEAQNDTLTEEHLKKLLAADPSIIDAVGGPLSVTPLATACWSGSLEAVCLLLDNPYRLADPNVLSPKNRTPLYYAVSRSPAANRKEIVSALLDAGARIDDTYPEVYSETPLMKAIADMGDKDVIHELVDRGASLTKRNKRGQTALMLAQGAGLELELQPFKERQLREEPPHSIQKELVDVWAAIAALLQPFKERRLREVPLHSIQTELVDVLVAITALIIAYFNNTLVTNLVNSVLVKLHEMNGEEFSDDLE
jgi:ankyrin repeat protein